MQTVSAIESLHYHDGKHDAWMAAMLGRVVQLTVNGTRPVFETTARDLWPHYLNSFPPAERQVHNCHACRRMIEQYGGLAVVDDAGNLDSLLWDAGACPEEYLIPVAALRYQVTISQIVRPFYSREKNWGTAVTGDWHHIAVKPPTALVYTDRALDPHQKSASKLQDYETVMRAIGEFPRALVEQAVTLLNTDSLFRAEKVFGPANFLLTLHNIIRDTGARRKGLVVNRIWSAIALAPEGFCHPRTSMVGTLLEDLAAGDSLSLASDKFRKKMHPLHYQRPQAAPAAGTIVQAEQLMAKLGMTVAHLGRRFARVEELQGAWVPRSTVTGLEAAVAGGMFAHLKPKPTSADRQIVAGGSITFVKFYDKVLPDALSVECEAPSHGNYAGVLTAEDPEAPNFFQWNNPFSTYVYASGSSASRWGLRGHAWTKVNAIVLNPSLWGPIPSTHHGHNAIIVLEGAKDIECTHLCLFPEMIRSEFHGVRAVMEAHGRSRTPSGASEGTANGLSVGGTHKARVRVTTLIGVTEYTIDRWD